MRAVLLCVLTGCSFSHGALGNEPSDGPSKTGDAPQDGTVNPDACVTFSTQLDTCNVPAGGDQPLTLSGVNKYDTTTNTLVTPNGSTNPPHRIVNGVDVLFASSFTLSAGASLQVAGTNAFGIAAGTVLISGALTGHAGNRSRAMCGGEAGGIGTGNTNGSGGGGGGGFHGAGGVGGYGDQNGTTTAPGGKGVAISARPQSVVGGCPGGAGGAGDAGAVEGGAGGGGFLIAARTSITIDAAGGINAGGAAGLGGLGRDGGGGGGGAGGMILLESASVTIAGVLAANGGSGGEGGGIGNGNPGEHGKPSAVAAVGGNAGDVDGGDGGNGSAGATLIGADSTQFLDGAGGGGGGGAGFIAIKNAPNIAGGIISPAYDPWP